MVVFAYCNAAIENFCLRHGCVVRSECNETAAHMCEDLMHNAMERRKLGAMEWNSSDHHSPEEERKVTRGEDEVQYKQPGIIRGQIEDKSLSTRTLDPKNVCTMIMHGLADASLNGFRQG